jgi:hypothetical protein
LKEIIDFCLNAAYFDEGGHSVRQQALFKLYALITYLKTAHLGEAKAGSKVKRGFKTDGNLWMLEIHHCLKKYLKQGKSIQFWNEDVSEKIAKVSIDKAKLARLHNDVLTFTEKVSKQRMELSSIANGENPDVEHKLKHDQLLGFENLLLNLAILVNTIPEEVENIFDELKICYVKVCSNL